MKNARHNLIYASCVAAGLFMAAAGAQAADRHVSEIYGRAAPSLTGPEASPQADRFQAVAEEQPVTTQVPQDSRTATASEHGPGQAAAASSSGESEITPTGEYLAVENPPERFGYYQGRSDDGDHLAYRREGENVEGMPLVDGRGMREGVEFQPVTTEPLYGVEEILGRASPPAPADHPDYILHV